MANLRRVIFVSLDTVRFDALANQPTMAFRERHHLDRCPMPNLDAFTQCGTTFRKAYATAPYTTASHASVFTGLYPQHNGIRAFYRNSLSPNVQTLAEILKENGFATWFHGDRPELFAPLGINRGFDREFTSDDDFMLAMEATDEPLFAFLHLFDAHKPYLVEGRRTTDAAERCCRQYIADRADELKLGPLPFSDNVTDLFWAFQSKLVGRDDAFHEMVQMYWKGLTQFDSTRLERFLGFLSDPGFLKDSLVVLFSDHGEDAVPGQILDHGGKLTEGKLRVLLTVAGAGWPAAQCDELVSLVDLFPTCLETILDNNPSEPTDGTSLVDRFRRQLPPRNVYAESWDYRSDEDPSRPERGPLAGTDWMLTERGLRTPERLWVQRGGELSLSSPEFRESRPEEFAQTVYRRLLGRYEDEGGCKDLSSRIESGASRNLAYAKVLLSKERRENPPLTFYDLKTDPMCCQPIPGYKSRLLESLLIRQQFRKLEQGAVLLPELQMSPEQQDLVCAQLQALGYLE